MSQKNLLAVLKADDQNHYLVRDFVRSLPSGTTESFHSFGFVGNFNDNVRSLKIERQRYFMAYRSAAFDNLVTQYFSLTPEAVLTLIPNQLKVIVEFKQQDTEFTIGARMKSTVEGSIDEMVTKYRSLARVDPRKLLADELNDSAYFRKNMTKKALFGFGKTKVVPIYVSVGLETVDGRFLVATTGPVGPYSGTLK